MLRSAHSPIFSFGNARIEQWLASRAWLLSCRATVAVVGGYALTSTSMLLLARILPLALPDAIMFVMMLSFAVYVVLFIWAFAARSVYRACTLLSAGSVLCGALAWLAGGTSA